MIRPRPISVEDARRLVDFGASAESRPLADRQLEGAVAIHNAIARHGFAYLADEVGMGKTYVALGVLGFIRHFHPTARALVIAPRANIQAKWVKELENFTRANWEVTDLRVKGIQGFPARPPVICTSLEDFARQAARNPDRDFFLRLPSFSLALREESGGLRKKAAGLLSVSPRLARFGLDRLAAEADRDDFKKAYARAVNSILPHFDLVVVDEGHNLKHGRGSTSSRSQLLSTVLGTGDEAGLTRRIGNLLVLSATPFETDFAELWRQLDLLGFARDARFQKLRAEDVGEEEKQRLAHEFLIRRLAGLPIGSETWTKNMYRSEWRRGGVAVHDEPLEIPSVRASLAVALVQKRVAELLREDRFGASFQIGMLASFESFFETARVRDPQSTDDDEGAVFDQREQTAAVEDEDVREGVDRHDVDSIARSHRRTFKGAPLPHPKMDAVVASLSAALERGEKSLVFVRRVKSVPELAEKLARRYDDWLIAQLRRLLPRGCGARGDLDRAFASYREFLSRRRVDDMDFVVAEADRGDETFFSWFFRGGTGRLRGQLTGADFRRNRLQNEGSILSTFFEDNYVAAALGDPDDVFGALAKALGISEGTAERQLCELAAGAPKLSRDRLRRFDVYDAFQSAALQLLAGSKSRFAAAAEIVWIRRYEGNQLQPTSVRSGFPKARSFLTTRTFFSALRARRQLAEALWPHTSPLAKTFDLRAFDDRERRRELLAATGRLGHTLTELWALWVRLSGTMRLRARETEGAAARFVDAFLDHLERERENPGLNAWAELSRVGANHELLLNVNFPEARLRTPTALGEYFGNVLGNQLPIAGIFGGVSRKVVSQFRMPGYPLVLVATEVLQEGEDLHTFCSRVVHYGIGWTPSIMEQRVGRVDRIGSLAHRRLSGRAKTPARDEKLQVFYPYLRETVELAQVRTVFQRMNEFLRLAHRGVLLPEDGKVNVAKACASDQPIPPPVEGPLKTPWDVDDRHTRAPRRSIRVDRDRASRLTKSFEGILKQVALRFRIEWNHRDVERGEVHGTVQLSDGRLHAPRARKQEPDGDAVRVQPFVLFIRSMGSGNHCALHAVSPVGNWRIDDGKVLGLARGQSDDGAKTCLIRTDHGSYNLTVEGDVLFDPTHVAPEEVADLVERVTRRADEVEEELLREDGRYSDFQSDLVKEVRHGPHSSASR